MEFDLKHLEADRSTREMLIGSLLLRYGFLTRETIGESRCSRPIDMLCIGNRRKQVLFAASFHGMEWITTMLMFRFLDEVCESVKNGTSLGGVRLGTLLNQRGLAVVPCVNPDGVEIQLHGADTAGSYRDLVQEASGGNTSRWQANAAGVDLNHNFSADWDDLHRREKEQGICAPSPTRFGGDYPESEPESRSLASYCRAGNISHALAFHSQGEEIYWEYGSYREAEALKMAQVMACVSGYRLAPPEGLADGGGFKDWFVEKFRRPAFTVEVGMGTNPLPMEMFEGIYHRIREMLILAVVL